jgi:hypothetical protein
MEIPQTPAEPAGLNTEESVRRELAALRSTTTSLLASMVCLAAALTMFFYHQARSLNRQVAEGERLINDYNSNAAPKIGWFVENLQAFAKTNPDLNPILAKYNLLPAPGPVAPAPRPATPKK